MTLCLPTTAYASAACTIDHSWFPTFPADNNGPRGYAAYTQAGVVIPESDIENNLYKFAIGSRIVPRCDSKRAAETRGYVCLHKSDSVTDYRWYTLDDFTETASSDLSNSDAYFSCYSPCGAITYNYPTQKAMFYEYSVTSSPYEITNSYAHGTVATLRCQSLIEDSTSFTNYGRLTCDDGEWVNHDSSVTITSGSSYMIDTEDTGCTYCNQTIAEMLEYVIEQGFLIPGAAGIQTDIVNANHWGVFRPTCMDETARALGTAQCKMGSWELNEVSSPSDIKCYPSECDAASIATNNAWSKVVTPDLNGVVSNVITPTYVCAPGTIPTPGTTLECEFSTSKFQWVDPNVACQVRFNPTTNLQIALICNFLGTLSCFLFCLFGARLLLRLPTPPSARSMSLATSRSCAATPLTLIFPWATRRSPVSASTRALALPSLVPPRAASSGTATKS